MYSATRITVSVFLITSALATAQQNTAKLRRDGVLNLYPFPRVGRSFNTWQIPLNDLYLEYKPNEKRQLYAFPRVGRDSAVRPGLQRMTPGRLEDVLYGRHVHVKRGESESTDSTGMWFGPRLGRSYKNDEDDLSFLDTERSEPEQTDLEHSEDRLKRQTNI